MNSTPVDNATDARFPSTYGRSLADLLASLLRQGGGSRVVDREQVRQLWRARYPQAAAESVKRNNRRPAAANDTVGTKAKTSLNQAYRALEQAGVINRRHDTVQVADVRLLVEIARQYTGFDAAFASPSTPSPKGTPLTRYDTHVMSMATHMGKDIAEHASNAASYATEHDNELHNDDARQVGALAYLQHVLAHTRELFVRELASRVREEGMTADAIAEGLAEHGITTTGEQLRAAYPQIVGMERQLRWLLTNGPRYLPLLHQVSRFVTTWPTLVRVDHHDKATETHRLIAATLSDVGWDGTTEGLSLLENWVFLHYTPVEHVWLSHMAVEVLPFGPVRDAALALQQLVAEFYEAGQGETTPSGDPAAAVMPGDPLVGLAVSVRGLDASIPLHTVGRVLS